MVGVIFHEKKYNRMREKVGQLLLKGTVGIGGVVLSIPFKSVGYVSLALEIANFDYSFNSK
jgi:hypothetical protein